VTANTDIQFLKGVGLKRAEILKSKGIDTVGALLRLFPRKYLDWTNITKVANAPFNQNVCIKAKIVTPIETFETRRGMKIYKFLAEDQSGRFVVSLFNQFYLANRLNYESEYLFYGKLEGNFVMKQMNSPIIKEANFNGLEPIYPASRDMTSKTLEKLIKTALTSVEMPDVLPENIRKTNNLCDIKYALENIHFPKSVESFNRAKQRLVFEELFCLQVALTVIKFKNHQDDIPGENLELGIVTEFINECAQIDTIFINITTPSAFEYTISDDVIYCENELPKNENVEINVTGGVGDITYEWSAGVTPDQATNTVGITQPATIYVTVTDACEREIKDSISFKVQGATVTASVDKQFICEGEVVNLSSTQAVEYAWTSSVEDQLLPNNNTQRNPQAQPTASSTYRVTIVDENGCVASDTVNVVVVPAIDAQLYLTPTRTSVLNTQIRFEDRTQGSYSREWDFGNGETSTQSSGVIVYSSDDTATYQVRLIAYNQAHCPDTAYGTVQVVPEFSIWIPTAFTPGTDDINAYFAPVFSTETEFEFTIYSRNGGKIFVSDDKVKAWDGKLKNGEYAPNGTYIYDLFYRDGDGLLQRRTGNVALIMIGNHGE
jgi:gliding motility-associated-like protein